MATDIRLKEALPEITEAIVATYTECRHTNHLGHKPLPSREAVADILADLLDIQCSKAQATGLALHFEVLERPEQVQNRSIINR